MHELLSNFGQTLLNFTHSFQFHCEKITLHVAISGSSDPAKFKLCIVKRKNTIMLSVPVPFGP